MVYSPLSHHCPVFASEASPAAASPASPASPAAASPAAASIANTRLLRDGKFVAEVGQIARAWAPTLKDLARVAPFVVRDAARVKSTYEQLFLGAAGEAVVEVHALATDLETETIRVQLTTKQHTGKHGDPEGSAFAECGLPAP